MIPFRLPSLNEVVETNRKNRFAGAKMKSGIEADILTHIYAAMRSAQLTAVRNPCIVHMVFEEPNRRRDVDNVESAKKFILDALVKSGVLMGDSPRHVAGSPSFTRYDGKNGARVIVTIIDDEDIEKLRKRLDAANDAVVHCGS